MDAHLDAVRHLRCDLVGDRDSGRWECRVLDGDGRVLATLTGTADFDLRFIDDHVPDAVTFTFTAPVLPPWPLPKRDAHPAQPDALLHANYDPDAYARWCAATLQRPQPRRDPIDPAAVPDLTLLGPVTLSAVSDPDGSHDRERPFSHTHAHTHVARGATTHTHPHTHARREYVRGEHRGGDHHSFLGAKPGEPGVPDQTDEPAGPDGADPTDRPDDS